MDIPAINLIETTRGTGARMQPKLRQEYFFAPTRNLPNGKLTARTNSAISRIIQAVEAFIISSPLMREIIDNQYQ